MAVKKKRLPDGMWLRGGTYYARFTTNGRTVRKKLAKDFEAAKEILIELRSRAQKCDFGLTDNDYAWKDLRKEFLAWVTQSLRRAHEYERDLNTFEAYSKVNKIREITPAYVIQYRSWRLAQGKRLPRGKKKNQPITPRTVNKEVSTLRNMLNKGVEWGRIGFNPIAGIKPLRHEEPAKERRALTVEEVNRLFAASTPRLLPIWRLMRNTGIRHDELVQMKFSDVDFERQTVTVRASTAKSGKPREIPLDDDSLATITELSKEAKHRRPMPGLTAKMTEQQKKNLSRDHVFVTQANTPWTHNLLRKFYAACKKAGIEDAHPGGSVDIHSLRVTFTTQALDAGANPKAVQAILGHATLDMTMRVYAKATERAKRDVINALPGAKVTTPCHLLSIDAHKSRTSPVEDTQTVAVKDLA